MKDASQNLINKLKLVKHSEGGYFAEHYRSVEMIQKEDLSSKFKGSRALSTAIYYLLSGSDFSSFHKLKTDEIWHFYSGSSLILYELDNNCNMETTTLSGDINENSQFTKVVRAGNWLAAEVKNKDSYSLVGCTLSPGFEFDDFELAHKNVLIEQYPKHIDIIKKLTK
jgi:predicted cupin superfamily sugar epimerase